MSSVAAIRAAIATTILAGVADPLFVYDTVPDLSQLPAVIVEPATADYVTTIGAGMDEWNFNVFVMCSRAVPGIGQNQLDDYVAGWGPNSIRRIVFQTPDLGLGDSDATVTGMKGYGGSWEIAKVEHVGAILRVRVYTDPKT